MQVALETDAKSKDIIFSLSRFLGTTQFEVGIMTVRQLWENYSRLIAENIEIQKQIEAQKNSK